MQVNVNNMKITHITTTFLLFLLTSCLAGETKKTPEEASLATPSPPPVALERTSCDPSERHPGAYSCCDNQTCFGSCYTPEGRTEFCSCGITKGGCIAGEACCGGMCVDPSNSICETEKGGREGPLPRVPPSTPNVNRRDKMFAVRRPVPDYVVVKEGNACDLPRDRTDATIKTCCNGAICNGRCLLYQGNRTPVCECAGIAGGCPLPHVCCNYVLGCTTEEACLSQVN